jgi:lipopolysaccharide/colanic/teichoic acid biosynthesis glycosyltransferase
MSLVGPRPLPIAYLPLYDENQRRRHEVRPGLTGLAQIHGRNRLSWEERFAFDVEYVDNLSLLLDIKIMLRTLSVVIKGGGVNAEERVTSEPFRGRQSLG